jgi:ketosteroid isomerase-like protein
MNNINLYCFFLLVFLASPMMGSPVHVPSHESDQQEVEEVITQLFDAMRENDMQKAADVFYESMQLSTVMDRGEGVELVHSNPADFLEAIGRPKDDIWDEHYSDLKIHVDGDLASAWMNYRFYRGEEFSHCGVNAIKFIRTGEGWKMFSITDTRKTEGC